MLHVRKHRAPKGALRLVVGRDLEGLVVAGQKAPSAKRCIKTGGGRGRASACGVVRKHRAPKGALRPVPSVERRQRVEERQKAPSAKRCSKTGGLAVVFLVCF